jgi:hypothetical protein
MDIEALLNQKDSFLKTYTGRIVDPLNLTILDVNIEDIAHALSHQCRFGGHTKEFYSVSQHSVAVAKYAYQNTRQIHTFNDIGAIIPAKQGLLHDATEAYFCDIPRPVKHSPLLHEACKIIEGSIWDVICHKFDIPSEMYEEVTLGDRYMLRNEFLTYFPTGTEHTIYSPGEFLEDPWDPKTAEENFLKIYKKLFLLGRAPESWLP